MITEHIQLIMVTIGLMTMGSLVFFLAPGVLGKRLLGISEISPGLILLARHWALLVSLVGAFLIYAAFDTPCKFPALLIASAEKMAFAGLVFMGPLKTSRPAQLAAAGDSFLAILCLACLVGL
jgi:hypothetical protein